MTESKSIADSGPITGCTAVAEAPAVAPARRRSALYRRVARIVITRVVTVLAMIFVVSSFTFFLVRILPGDPVATEYQNLLMQGMTPEQAGRQVQSMYGFISNQPVGIQYLHYLGNLLRLDLGVSISFNGIPVSHLLAAAAPYTVVLVLLGIVVSFVFGVALGVVAAVGRSTRFGDLISISGAMLHGIPQFVMAIALLYIFPRCCGSFPTAHRTTPA